MLITVLIFIAIVLIFIAVWLVSVCVIGILVHMSKRDTKFARAFKAFFCLDDLD